MNRQEAIEFLIASACCYLEGLSCNECPLQIKCQAVKALGEAFNIEDETIEAVRYLKNDNVKLLK